MTNEPATLPDPIDETFLLDPLDESFTPEVLLANTKKLIALFRVEITEFNRAQIKSEETGTKRSGSATKAAQKRAVKSKLTANEQAALAAAREAPDAEAMF